MLIPEMIVVPTDKTRARELKKKLEEYRANNSPCEVKIIETLFSDGWADFELVQEQMRESVADSNRLLEAWKVIEEFCS